MKKRFRSGVNIHRTRSFPGADIGSDHDLVMMTFQVRLKKTRKPNQPRLRFDLEKLRDPDVACTFQATIGGKFAPLIGLSDEDMDMDTMITTYNTAVTDAASEILGKQRRRKKPWITKDVLDLCDERRDLKKKRYEAEGAKEYREANRRIQKAVKKAKEDWIGAQCEEIETCLNKNNSKRAYQLVKDLTSEKQDRSSTIQETIENSTHFFFNCSRYTVIRQSILAELVQQCTLKDLLYGKEGASTTENERLFLKVQSYIIQTKRFAN